MASNKEKSAAPKAAKSKTPSAPETKLKVIIRRLPPHLPEPIFWQSVSSWVTDETCTWKVFYQGKPKTRDHKEVVPSRAYVAFKNVEQLVAFSKAYDGHLFRDKRGNETFAVVEFAPFQKTPTDKKKQDPRAGTIEEDDDFKSFVASLNEEVAAAEIPTATKPSQSQEPTTTPLLASLLAEKSAQKGVESILRYHGHYRASDLVTSRRSVDDDPEFSRSSQKKMIASRPDNGDDKAEPLAPNPAQAAASSKKSRQPKPQSLLSPPPPASKGKGSNENTSTSPKKRPTFKFDAAIAVVRPGDGSEVKPVPARIDGDNQGEFNTPRTPNTDGGTSRRARQRQRQREQKKGDQDPSTSGTNAPGPSRTILTSANKSQQANQNAASPAISTARIDDAPPGLASSVKPAAGIISIPAGADRGRGRGGRGEGRGRGGRGKGRGRGVTDTPTPRT